MFVCLHNPCCLLKLIKVRVTSVFFFYRKGSLSQFTVLCEKYQPSIERDPVYKEVRRVCFFSLSNIESACNTIKIFCSSMQGKGYSLYSIQGENVYMDPSPLVPSPTPPLKMLCHLVVLMQFFHGLLFLIVKAILNVST